MKYQLTIFSGCIILLVSLITANCYAQRTIDSTKISTDHLVSQYDTIVYDLNLSGIENIEKITPITRPAGICNQKVIGYLLTFKKEKKATLVDTQVVMPTKANSEINRSFPKPSFVKITGNVLYNFNYRSYIDTPYAQDDLHQHTVQTTLNIVLKDRYPLNIAFSQRFSNSSFFSNTTNLNLGFRQSALIENIKAELRNDIDGIDKFIFVDPHQLYNQNLAGVKSIVTPVTEKNITSLCGELLNKNLRKSFDSLYSKYEESRDKLNKYVGSVKRTNPTQQIIEERERELIRLKLQDTTLAGEENIREEVSDKKGKINVKLNNADSALEMIVDSLRTYSETQLQINPLKQLQKEVEKDEKAVRLFQNKIKDSLLSVRRRINMINNSENLYEYLNQGGSNKDRLTKVQKIMLSVNQIGLGRTWIDYSELTVKNISLSGVNIEINPGKVYLAAATGRVNFSFRDFVLNENQNTPTQSVSLVRAGIGKKNNNNIIVTYYSGQKTVLNSAGITPISSATIPIMGVALETRIKVESNTYLIAEFARSSYTNLPNQLNNTSLLNKVLDFKITSNQAWNVKVFSSYPATSTKADGYYRRIGEAFQSFSLYTSNSKQDAWLLHVSQPFLMKKITVDGSIKKNDFSSPIAAPDFASSTIFKSAQVTVRVPKYPFVTVGYYPSSQLLVGNNSVLYESQFNSLNFIAGHSYHIMKISMNTNAVLTKFYNSSTDTGFLYYNASSFTINHSAYFNFFILEGIINITSQSKIQLLTLEPKASYQYKSILVLSGSIKVSRLNSQETLWGGIDGTQP